MGIGEGAAPSTQLAAIGRAMVWRRCLGGRGIASAAYPLDALVGGAEARDGADVVGDGDERGARQVLAGHLGAPLRRAHVPEAATTHAN